MFGTFEKVTEEEIGSCRIVTRQPIETYEDLVDQMFNFEVQYNFWKNQYERTEVDLWLNTDWDDAFPDKKPTVKEKEMWIKQQLLNIKELRDTAKVSLDDVKRLYDLVMKFGLDVLNVRVEI